MTTEESLVSLYRCTMCGRFRIVEKGNYHPWCLPCGSDLFDWNSGIEDVPRKVAESAIEKDPECPERILAGGQP